MSLVKVLFYSCIFSGVFMTTTACEAKTSTAQISCFSGDRLIYYETIVGVEDISNNGTIRFTNEKGEVIVIVSSSCVITRSQKGM
jgi:hypothetical protein